MKQISIDCGNKLLNAIDCRFTTNAAGLIGVVNALSYVLNNKEKYMKETGEDCEDCFDSIMAARDFLSEELLTAIEHTKEHEQMRES